MSNSIRGRVRCTLLASVAFVSLSMSTAWAQSVNVTTPEQPLAQSLKDVARQTGENILFTPEAVAGIKAHPLSGKMSAQDAVNALLAGTGLEAVSDGNGGLVVRKVLPKNVQAASNEKAAHPATQAIESVVVTGTHIAGVAPVGSQLTVYTRQDIDQSGAGTVDQFARQIPENLSNTDTVSNMYSTSALAVRPGGDPNNNMGSAFNLNGLGISSTLTLIDGHRVAASGDAGSFVDVSMIPLSAVDHIEVLQDGSSAIYGSDAVAGVVNIVMRKDFDGAESQLRYGEATDGGAAEFTGSQAFGKTWETGNILVNYEFDKQWGLDASQRSYIPDQGGPDSLIPENTRNSVFLAGNQEIDSDTTISGEFLYSNRDTSSAATTSSLVEDVDILQSGRTEQSGETLSLDRRLWGDWQASLTGNYSQVQESDGEGEVLTVPHVFSEDVGTTSLTKTTTSSLDALVNGTLFSTSGGDVKVALGGTYRNETFAVGTTETLGGATTVYSYPSSHRDVESGFAEFYVPLVGEANAMPFVRRLDFSAAVRYDDYSDFGSTTNPKIGAIWGPTDDFDLRGTYGTSFQAPLLQNLNLPVTYEAAYLPNPAATPIPATDTILEGGGNPDLKPEKATVFTGGVNWHPIWLPELTASATYSNVNYTNLIGQPPITSEADIFGDPVLATFIQFNPPLAEVQADFNSPGFQGDSTHLGPAGVKAIFDERVANLAAERESNIDFRASYSLATDFGQIAMTGVVDRYLNDALQTAPLAPSEEIDSTFGEPPRWKARGNVAWSRDGFTAAATLNYTGSYSDNLVAPSVRIGSWITADAYFSYATGTTAASAYLQNLRVSLTVQNVADTKPPFVVIPALLPGQNPIPYDAVNASPVGRLIAVQLTKDF